MTEKQNKNFGTKKEFILRTLKTLEWHWDMAPGFYKVMSSKYVTEDVLDDFMKILSESINSIENESIHSSIKNQMNKMHNLEDTQKKNKEKELNTIISDID